MELVPVLFKLERKSFLSILTVTGICKDMFGAKNTLLSKAVEIIEMTQNEFKGKLIELMDHERDIAIQNGMIAVRFYILFRNEEEFNQAITRIQKELG